MRRGDCQSTSGTPLCRCSSGSASWSASGSWTSTGGTWVLPAGISGREISQYRGALPETTSAALAAHLLGRLTTPSQAAIRAERKIRLQEAL